MIHFPSHGETFDELFEVILSLQNIDECRAFFCDLCTIQELMSLSQRLLVAKKLLSGESYKEIQKQITISSATITRINTALQYGSGGYRMALLRETDKTQE